jgi:hypothetical protein
MNNINNYFWLKMSIVKMNNEDVFITKVDYYQEIIDKFDFNSFWISNNSPTKKYA